MTSLRAQLEGRLFRLRRSDPRLPGVTRATHLLGWLLGAGVEMTTAAEPWSAGERRFIALLTRAVPFRPGRCFANAQRAVLLAPSLGAPAAGHRLRYWEGYALLSSLPPFTHAWCVLNGRLWDPSVTPPGLPVRYLGTPIPEEFLSRAVPDRRTYGAVLPHWHRRLVGRREPRSIPGTHPQHTRGAFIVGDDAAAQRRAPLLHALGQPAGIRSIRPGDPETVDPHRV